MKKFNGFKQAWLHLVDQKYAAPNRRKPIGSSKFYKDVRNGMFPVLNEAAITEDELGAYILKAGLVKLTGNAENIDRLAAEEKKSRMALMDAKRRAAEFALEKERGLYLRKADVQAELAMKLGTMEACWKNLVATNLVEWIQFVGGDIDKTDDLREIIFTRQDEMLNELCSFDELNIVIRPDGASEQLKDEAPHDD